MFFGSTFLSRPPPFHAALSSGSTSCAVGMRSNVRGNEVDVKVSSFDDEK